MIDTNSISSLRFQNQFLGGIEKQAATKLLQKMGPIQAQDYEMALWAIGLRTGLKLAALQQSVLEGKIIRTHILRPTWHFVNADQIYDFLALTAPNIISTTRSRHAKLGIDDALVAKAKSIFERELIKSKFLTRQELKPHLLAAGFDLSGNRFYHLLLRAALDGLICGGVPKGKEQSYTLLADFAPPQPSKPASEILHNLAKCYFQSRGPARLKDFSWWAGLKQKQAKQALLTIADQLEENEIEGELYYRFPEITKSLEDDNVYFLPAYDESIIAYQDKALMMENPAFLSQIAKSGLFYPMIVYRGKIIGKWKPKKLKAQIEIVYQLFDDSAKPSLSQLQEGIASYGHFVERSVSLQKVF